ncbi:hypothetical protein [Prevotella histicola]|uniref:hypothetical protein n=1 Tax=Prevotella histicola TaxID=470565 RepID=UPI002151EAC0|nr:hypothetical protein [Prevotella histicola]
MEKILLSFVSTFGSATTQDIIDSVSIILIGLSLLIILYRIQKWIIKVNENTSYLKEVLQTYKQLQEEKETKITARRTEGKFDDEFSDKELKYIKKSMIEKIGSESNKEADDMAFDIINVCQELLGEPQFESVDEIVSFNF